MPDIRIASWNQGHNTLGPRSIELGWRFLLAQQHADLLILQETVVPETLGRDHHVSFLPLWPKRPWGNAVCTPGPHEVVLADPALRVLAVDTEVDGIGHVVLASFHAGIVEHRTIPGLRKSVEALLPLLDGNRFIVGGDLNTARGAAQLWPDNGHAEFFEWLETLGWHDCHWRLHGKERVSVWATRSAQLQLDHVFTDVDTGQHVSGVEVLDDVEVRGLSDHGPVVVDISTGT